MGRLREVHKVEDGARGLLHGAFDVGAHVVEIQNERGEVVGRGTGATEEAARERAWKDANS